MDSAHRSGPYEKIPPVPGTNQIAGFVGFHPLTSRKKDNDIYLFIPGAIIRDNFLFLEQIAPSPVAHARTCCEDFHVCCASETAFKIVYAFGPQLTVFMAFGILLKYFRRKLLQFWMYNQKSYEFRAQNNGRQCPPKMTICPDKIWVR